MYALRWDVWKNEGSRWDIEEDFNYFKKWTCWGQRVFLFWEIIPRFNLLDLLDLIYSYGAEPAFKGYKASFANLKYQYALCFSPNEIVAHGYPEKAKYLKEGDVASLDLLH